MKNIHRRLLITVISLLVTIFAMTWVNAKNHTTLDSFREAIAQYLSAQELNKRWPKGRFTLSGTVLKVHTGAVYGNVHIDELHCFAIIQVRPNDHSKYRLRAVHCKDSPDRHIQPGMYIAEVGEDDDEYTLSGIVVYKDGHEPAVEHTGQMDVIGQRDAAGMPKEVIIKFDDHTTAGTGGSHGGAAHAKD